MKRISSRQLVVPSRVMIIESAKEKDSVKKDSLLLMQKGSTVR